MEVVIAASGGKDKTKKIDVSDKIFACDFNEALVHQVVTSYLATGRSGSKAQKSRSEVRGGGKKPWRQKGTGRARAGTSRSPIWRSGGVTFAAKPRDFSQKVNRKVYRNAIALIFSELMRKDRLIVTDTLSMPEIKTKSFLEKISGYDVEEALIITDELDRNLYLSARNLPQFMILDVTSINPVELIRFKNVIITEAAVRKIEEWLQ